MHSLLILLTAALLWKLPEDTRSYTNCLWKVNLSDKK